jgi:hypothetical protein
MENITFINTFSLFTLLFAGSLATAQVPYPAVSGAIITASSTNQNYDYLESLAQTGASVLTLSQDNIGGFVVPPGAQDLVIRIEGEIRINQFTLPSTAPNIVFIGGTIVGQSADGTDSFTTNSKNTFVATRFRDISVHGRFVSSFQNCRVEGTVTVDKGASFQGGSIQSAALIGGISIYDAEIDASTLLGVSRISNSELDEVTIGSLSDPAFVFLNGNTIDDSHFYIGKGSDIIANSVNDTSVWLPSPQGDIMIASNKWTDVFKGEASAINVVLSGDSSFKRIYVSNNSVDLQSDESFVAISGEGAGNSKVVLSNNVVTEGEYIVDNSALSGVTGLTVVNNIYSDIRLSTDALSSSYSNIDL